MMQHDSRGNLIDIDSIKPGVCKYCRQRIYWCKRYEKGKWYWRAYDDSGAYKPHQCPKIKNQKFQSSKNQGKSEYYEHLLVAKTGNRGEIRVFQKVQNLAMHAGSRTQSIPKWLVESGQVEWVQVGRRYYLRISMKAYEWNPEFWATKMTFEDEIELQKQEEFEAARNAGVTTLDSFLGGGSE